jgi:Nucleotidyl transferase AbiEii toxin, Type IV TA system
MMRLAELRDAGITATTISRIKEKGLVLQLSRGLHQLADASIDTQHALAEAAKRVPKGVVCLTSALAFHGLTDAIPSRVWMAIGSKDRRPRIEAPPMQFVRFGEKVLLSGITEHLIENVSVRIYSPAKTIVDLFRYRRGAGKRFQKSPGLISLWKAWARPCAGVSRRRPRLRALPMKPASGSRSALSRSPDCQCPKPPKPPIKNMGASVRARLLILSKERRQSFELLLNSYILERLLYRLSQTKYRDRFILKGAMLLTGWFEDPLRPTRDLDLLAIGKDDEEEVVRIFAEICARSYDDGVRFDPKSIRVDRIHEQTDYGGLRITAQAKVDTGTFKITVDVAFGDSVEPDLQEMDLPVLLDFPAPHLRAYAREAVIAEKFQAMVLWAGPIAA